jgi:hypothetical protein
MWCSQPLMFVDMSLTRQMKSTDVSIKNGNIKNERHETELDVFGTRSDSLECTSNNMFGLHTYK